MAFKDKFPLELEFEIDRKGLVRYYRFQSFVGCVAFAVPVGIFVAFGFLKPFVQINAETTVLEQITTVVCFTLGGLIAGLLFALALYYLNFHKSSHLAAHNLRLRVEGPYLRLVSGSFFVMDRRYHFKDIHTYTTFQSPFLGRFGMKRLLFNVSDRQIPPVHVDGLIDVDSVRDKLCEIDAARELT